MYPRVCNNDTRPGCILNGKARFPVLASHAANGAGEVVPPEHFHVGHLKRLDVQIIKSKQRHGILRFEAFEMSMWPLIIKMWFSRKS